MTLDDIEMTVATETDAGVLALVSQRAFEHVSEEHGKRAWGPRGYKSEKDHKYYIEKLETYCILLKGVIIGGMIISDNGVEHKEFVRLFIDPDFQRNGYGTWALNWVMKESPAKVWTVGNIEWNDTVKMFLESNGFQKIGHIKTEPHATHWYRKVIEEVQLPKISELSADISRIIVEGEIIEKAMARQVRSRQRWKTLLVTEATLKDDSGDIVLMMWNDQIKQGQIGDRVRIEGGYFKLYRGMRQLNIGKVGKLIKLD